MKSRSRRVLCLTVVAAAVTVVALAAPSLASVKYSSADLPIEIGTGGGIRTYGYDGEGERVLEERASEWRVRMRWAA